MNDDRRVGGVRRAGGPGATVGGLLLLLFGGAGGAFPAAVSAQTELDRLEAELDRDGAEQPGYLGLIGNDKDEQGRGIRVVDLVEGGPAAAAGIKKGDLITAIDGRPLPDLAAMDTWMRQGRAGKRMEFDLVRDGQARRLLVTLGRRPGERDRKFPNFGKIPDAAPGDAAPTSPDAPEALPLPDGAGATPGRALLGVRSLPVTDAKRRDLRLPSALGAMVVQVTPGSPADTAGLRVDDVIVAVDAKVVNRPGDLTAAVLAAGPGKEIQVSYYREGRFARVTAVPVAPERLPNLAGTTPPAGPLPSEVPLNPAGPNVVQRPVGPPDVRVVPPQPPSATGDASPTGPGGVRWMRSPRAPAAGPAREELPLPGDDPAADAGPAAERVKQLEQEIVDLHARIRKLEQLLEGQGKTAPPAPEKKTPPPAPVPTPAPPVGGPSLGTAPEA